MLKLFVCKNFLRHFILWCRRLWQFWFGRSHPIPSTNALSEVAKELGVVIIASFREKERKFVPQYHRNFRCRRKLSWKYRKCTFQMILLLRKFYFTPGDLGYKVFQTKFAKNWCFICWDQWYPEASRITALMGAGYYFTLPQIIGQHQDEETNADQYNAWQTISEVTSCKWSPCSFSKPELALSKMALWNLGGSFVANAQVEIIVSHLTTKKK